MSKSRRASSLTPPKKGRFELLKFTPKPQRVGAVPFGLRDATEDLTVIYELADAEGFANIRRSMAALARTLTLHEGGAQ